MTVDLYYMELSAPCNSIILLAKTLGVELNLIKTDLWQGEHMTESFLKMNPEHTIPTLNDNGVVLWESRAILVYLFDKYGKDDSLYPKDAQKRAIVNQRLFFDLGTYYQRLANYYYPQAFEGKPAVPENLVKIAQAFEFLDTHLGHRTFAAGETPTLADFSLAASTLAYVATGYDFSKYTNVVRWFKACEATLPGWQEVAKNMATFKVHFENL